MIGPCQLAGFWRRFPWGNPAWTRPSRSPEPANGTRAEGRLTPMRDARLDLARGAALLAIFIDHIYSSWLLRLTPQGWQACDFAEVFVFVSGYAAALRYGPLLEQRGWRAAQRKALARCWTLYRAQLAMMMITLLTVYVFWQLGLREPVGYFKAFAESPRTHMVQALYFGFAPYIFSVLPLYCVLVLAMPSILAAARWSPAATLGASLFLYAATSVVIKSGWFYGAPAPHTPNHAWYFNPFAWQLVFTAGLLAPRFRWPVSVSPQWMRRLALATVLGFVILMVSHQLCQRYGFGPHWELRGMGKTLLGPLRLVNFAAWLVLAQAWLDRVPPYPWLLRCGRHSLWIFCVGTWLSVVTDLLIRAAHRGVIVQAVLPLGGVALLLALALLLDRKRLAARPEPAQPVCQ